MEILKTYSRIYPDKLEESIALYTKLTNQKIAQRFTIPETGVEIAYIGDFILVYGQGDLMKQFRKVHASCIVQEIEEIKLYLLENHSTIITDIQNIPTGKKMIARHPDGIFIEYLELK